ncbi:hypothetical protein [Nocardia sp. NPDC004860]|uniref:hypothetical protein n=1 Tax=Nocardia sp. NPDC004860 TaxID=3154557 RepID=UPI0033B45ADA
MTNPALTHFSPAPGIEIPTEDTPVLVDRELVPGTDPTTLSRFGDDRWHLNAAIFEASAEANSWNFALIPEPLRLTAKHFVWQLINTDCPIPINRAKISRCSIRTITAYQNCLREFTIWLHRHGVTELRQVTADLLDDYLADLSAADIPLARKHDRVTLVRRLWSYRDTLPEDMRLPAPIPWDGDRGYELLGKRIPARDNATPRIAENTMQSLLAWSLRFVEDFADDIVAAYAEHLFLQSRTVEGRRRRGSIVRPPRGQNRQNVIDYLNHLRRTGGTLPGRIGPGGAPEIDWQHLGRILEYTPHSLKREAPGKLIIESAIPLADNAYLDTPITAKIDGRPWRDRPIAHFEAPELAHHLRSACAVVIGYLSGARPGEVLDLRRGCVHHDPATGLWLMSGTYFKNARDQDGNKIPAGAPRHDPWVVVEPVAAAVATLQRLHSNDLLFANRIDHARRHAIATRTGEARVSSQIARDLDAFIDWVNAHSHDLGVVGIPADPNGRITLSRFRRTLGWFIRRRPRGLVAGALQYGHVGTRIFQGYAGDLASGFPDDYAFEDFLARLDELSENQQKLDAGEHVSGPAADAYRTRISAAHKQFAGHVLTSRKQARDLLGNPLLQIFHGHAMTCVFDPHQAACQLRVTTEDPMVTPDIGDCRPRCPNIARTDRDIAEIRTRRDELAEIVADPLAPPIRHHREQHELDRLDTILENHQ